MSNKTSTQEIGIHSASSTETFDERVDKLNNSIFPRKIKRMIKHKKALLYFDTIRKIYQVKDAKKNVLLEFRANG